MNGERSNRFRLVTEILERSAADAWNEARHEWDLMEVYREDEPQECLCGHTPIIEICVLRNRCTGYVVTVGNVCVTKFLGLGSNRIFEGLKRVAKNSDKALNEATTEYAHNQGWITDWERDFSLNTNRKRNLSDKQVRVRSYP